MTDGEYKDMIYCDVSGFQLCLSIDFYKHDLYVSTYSMPDFDTRTHNLDGIPLTRYYVKTS